MMNLLSDIYRKCTQFDFNRRNLEWITKIPWFLGPLVVLWVLVDVSVMLRCNEMSIWGMHKSIIESAYSDYLNSNNFSFTNAEDYSTIQSNLLGAIYVVLTICMDGLTRSCYIICACGGLAFLLTVNVFLNHVQLQDPRKRLPEVLDILDQFQLALSHASDSLGLLYLMICVVFLPYYCLALPILFGGHALRVAEVVCYCIAFGLATFPAAHAHNSLKSIVPLIQMSYTGANASFLSTDINMRVNLAAQSLHANTFALSGKIFVITYGFIGSICGLVVTFAVILPNLAFKTYDIKS
ncbi:unnamed protein product [Allacma fusca]|uniref:Uncharacterized protein n=1 Tax=Allacma fusca TaxID=39272 RepID=A0A8J2JUV7_9HEXA|nr:unnamed protein product [Allacma fusca]